jgi:hypothetical protein
VVGAGCESWHWAGAATCMEKSFRSFLHVLDSWTLVARVRWMEESWTDRSGSGPRRDLAPADRCPVAARSPDSRSRMSRCVSPATHHRERNSCPRRPASRRRAGLEDGSPCVRYEDEHHGIAIGQTAFDESCAASPWTAALAGRRNRPIFSPPGLRRSPGALLVFWVVAARAVEESPSVRPIDAEREAK